MQRLAPWSRDVVASTQQRSKNPATLDSLRDNSIDLMWRHPPIPDALSRRQANLRRRQSISHTDDERKSPTIALPAYLCPPMCEFFRMSARFSDCRPLSCCFTCASFSSAEPEKASSGSLPWQAQRKFSHEMKGWDRTICAVGSSSRVSTCQPSLVKALQKLLSSVFAAMWQRLSRRLCEPEGRCYQRQ